MTTTKTANGQTAAQRLAQAMSRYQDLVTRFTRAETEVKTAERQLVEVRAEAEQEIGISDLDQVREEFVKSEAENEKAVDEFIASLDKYEAELREVEKQLAG